MKTLITLIAESGSSKTDWRMIAGSKILKKFTTNGFNPNIQSMENMNNQVVNEVVPYVNNFNIDTVFFYGAGFSHLLYNESFSDIMKELINAKQIFVEHDLLAAARSLCGHNRGVACILGTGSNSCLYDGINILQRKGGHGYILNDEGSGSDMGKRLLKKLLDNELPEKIKTRVEKFRGKTLDEIKMEIYEHSKPNVYLAEFSHLIFKLKNNPEINRIIYESLSDFFAKTILKYAGYNKYPVGFVGSIAYCYKQIIIKLCKENNIHLGKIIKNPIEELVKFHCYR